MPIADLQRRDTEVGRIRLGKKTASGRADKLDTFRFTSPDQAMIEEIAQVYGGTAAPWMNEKKRQFEVITEKDVIPVYIPPQVIDPWYESWGAGVCQRRCDGIRDIIHDQPCDCTTDQQGKKSRCKPTTRVNLYLAEIPGMGVWRLETHGIYAAGEMVQLSDRINGIKVPLPARLHLEQRGRKYFNPEKNRIETLDYPVPVLWLDSITTQHVALGGDAVSQVVRAAAAQRLEADTAAAIEASAAPALPAAPPAAPAAPARPPVDPQMVRRALATIAVAQPGEMGGIRERIRQTGDHQQLLDAFQLRLGEQEAEAAEARRVEAERRPPARVMDGGGDDEPPYDQDEDEDEPSVPIAVAAIDDAVAAGASAPWADGERESMLTAAATEWAAAAPVATPEPERAAPGTEAPPAAPAAPEASGDTSGDRQAAMTRLLLLGSQKSFNRAALDEHMKQQHGVGLKAATTEQLAHLVEWIGG